MGPVLACAVEVLLQRRCSLEVQGTRGTCTELVPWPQRRRFFVCSPEGGATSSRTKQGFSPSLRQHLRGVTEKWFGRVG
jgi:hypothetical protein